MALVVTIVAALAFLVALGLVLPRPPSRTRVWVTGRARRLWLRLGGRESATDPFEVLRLQTRLGELSYEIRVLHADGARFAKAHHLEAARAAYDDLLAEACALAGVEVPVDPPGDARRWKEEQELAARGWSW
jgi:hypothetical protein